MSTSHRSDDDLLKGFFGDDTIAIRELRARFDHRLLNRVGPLPPALQGLGLEEDLLQRAYEIAYRAGPDAFDPGRGELGAYLAGVARNAKRDVCAEHAPPGEPTRPRKDADGEPIPWKPTVVLEEDKLEAPADEIEAVVNGVFVDELTEDAELMEMETVVNLIDRMRQDRGISEAAKSMGISRFTARRTLDHFALAMAS
ncbi:MAG TPA: hypothetical protein VGB06_09605 [Solirubrobacterales bacterium]|jgi:hypothetical protein